MRGSQCPSLHRLGLLLRAAYRVRNGLAVTEGVGVSLSKAEVDLERVHQLISRHREVCPHCKFDEALASAPTRVTIVPIDRAN